MLDEPLSHSRPGRQPHFYEKFFFPARARLRFHQACMFLWIIALVLVAALGLIGYYQGALRAAFSMVGLILGILLAKPVGSIFNFILPALGLTHPAILSFVSPLCGFLVVIIAFKIAGIATHKKIDTWYKYKGSDTERLLYERLNSRVGIALGIVNAYIYTLLLASSFYAIGYFSYQMSTNKDESWIVNSVNRVSHDIQTTGMIKSIAPFNPATETYYDACDVLGDLFHSPLLQSRLANYPLFLTLGEKTEFKSFSDAKFQEQWASGMSLREFVNHEKVKPLIENQDIFTNVLALVKPDLKDLKTYLETGNSPKYDDEKILGRWEFNARESIGEARRRKPNIGTAEVTRLRRAFAALFANATLVATVDNKAILKLPTSPQNKQTRGTWKSAGGGQYIITVGDDEGKSSDAEAQVDGKKMTLKRGNFVLVFDNTRV